MRRGAMTMGCGARVWDNGDMIDCGEKVLRGNRCARHVHDEVCSLLLEIKKKKAAVARLEKRLAELQTESG